MDKGNRRQRLGIFNDFALSVVINHPVDPLQFQMKMVDTKQTNDE